MDNPEILKYFIETGFDARKVHYETAWCSAFVNWCAIKANCAHSNELNARSWLKVGNGTYAPCLGDVVVFWREGPKRWRGHVGFFIAGRNGFIYILGGNQKNAVNVYWLTRGIEYSNIENFEL